MIATSSVLKKRPDWIVLLTLCLAVLIAQVDTSVVNLAIHPIGHYFHSGVSTLQWVADSYNLVYAAFLLTGGLLADLFGRRRIFIVGVSLFAFASALCALSPTITVLIGGRILAGLGAALLLPASLALVRIIWPDPVKRNKALGIWAGCNGLAFAAGPTLGGALINFFGWRSIFLVVIPLAIATLILASLCLPESSDRSGRHFDAAGQLLGILGLGGVAAIAIESSRFLRQDLLVLVAGVFVILATFILLYRAETKRGPGALVPPDLFRLREFSSATIATAGMTFGMYGVIFLIPLEWQSSGLLTPLGAGIALMPMALLFVLISPFTGNLSSRLGLRPLAAGGVAIIGTGLILIGLTTDARSILVTEIGLCITGIGMGLGTGPLMALAVGAPPPERSGTAASLINVARMVGATLGVAVLGTIYVMTGRGIHGLRSAMYIGGGMQLVSAVVAWQLMKSQRG